MPLAPSFSINATNPVNPAQIVLVDTSTGADAAIVSRQVLFNLASNSLFVPAQPWALAAASITYGILTNDLALNVTVNWLAGDGVTVLYSSSQIYAFTNFSELFYYGLTQTESSSPLTVQGENFYRNKELLRLYLDSAKQAIAVGADLYSAQSCIQKAIFMCQQHQIYFNV